MVKKLCIINIFFLSQEAAKLESQKLMDKYQDRMDKAEDTALVSPIQYTLCNAPGRFHLPIVN